MAAAATGAREIDFRGFTIILRIFFQVPDLALRAFNSRGEGPGRQLLEFQFMWLSHLRTTAFLAKQWAKICTKNERQPRRRKSSTYEFSLLYMQASDQ